MSDDQIPPRPVYPHESAAPAPREIVSTGSVDISPSDKWRKVRFDVEWSGTSDMRVLVHVLPDERLPVSAAPAWTREAPTSEGLFWIRFEGGSFADGSTVAFWVPPFEGDADNLTLEGEAWTLAEAREFYPEFEWWPIPLEPPA